MPRADSDTEMARNTVELSARNTVGAPKLCRAVREFSQDSGRASPDVSVGLRRFSRQGSLRGSIISGSEVAFPLLSETTADITETFGYPGSTDSRRAPGSSSSLDVSRAPSSACAYQSACSGSNDLDRRVIQRLGGSHLNGPTVCGRVESGTSQDAYQPAGTSCGGVDAQVCSGGYVGDGHVRQQDDSGSDKQDRFEMLRDPSKSVGPISVSVEAEDANNVALHSRRGQRGGRRTVSGRSSRGGVGTSQRKLQVLRRSSRIAGRRLDRVSNQSQDPSLPGQVSTSKSARGRCLRSGLERVQQHLHLPSSERDSSGDKETPEVSRQRSSYSSESTDGILVSLPDSTRHQARGHVGGATESSGIMGKMRTDALRRMDRLSFLGMIYGEQYPPDVANALLSSYRDSSNHQFESGWRAFKAWLPSEVAIVTKSVFLSFLVHLRKCSYHTALGYRNALKIPLDVAFGIQTSDKEFDMIAKSHFLANPPRQKIIPSWDLSSAMLSLRAKGSLSALSRTESFYAIIFLVSVATGNRVSELANLYRRGVSFSANFKAVVLPVVPGFLYKNQSANRTPLPIRIVALNSSEDSILCPVKSVDFLLKNFDFSKDRLFCNPSTGASLTAATFAFWLCKAINWLIPEAIPRAHDVRKNAFSMAWVRGVPLNEIVKQGFWSSSSVFFRRYFSEKAGRAACPGIVAGS